DLYMAMKGAGTDRDAIYKALSSCKNNEEKDKLINTYRNKYNRDLQADIKEELAGTDYYKAFDMLQKEPKNLEERKEQMTEKLSRGRNSGDVWSQVSNNIMDVFSEEGRNVDDSERELRDTYKQVEKIEKQGEKPDAKLLEKLDKAENKVKVNIDDYEESKNNVADGLSTAASITAAVAVTVATGGAGSLAVPAIIGSALTCATMKVGINKLVKGNSYDLNSSQALADFTAGAIEGALNVAGGPLMDKFSKLPVLQRVAVMSTIMKNPVITKALSKGTVEGMTSFIENKAVQDIVKEAVSGAISSGIQGGVTTAVDENTWSDGIGEGLKKVGESGVVQAETGLVTSAVMTTAFKAGGHILGKLKPKADTLDGLEVKLNEPEKFSKAKEILSVGTHSEAEVIEKLKNAGFNDEEIKSVLKHKSSSAEKILTDEASVKKIGQKGTETLEDVKGIKIVDEEIEIKKSVVKDGEAKKVKESDINISEVNKSGVWEDGKIIKDDIDKLDMVDTEKYIPSEDAKKFLKDVPKQSPGEVVNNIKKKYPEAHPVKFNDNIEINFYGSEREAGFIQEAINQLPAGMKEKFIEKIKAGGIKEILADAYHLKGSPKNLGFYDPNNGNIVLNKKFLNYKLEKFEDLYKGRFEFFQNMTGKSSEDISKAITKWDEQLKVLEKFKNKNMSADDEIILKEMKKEYINFENKIDKLKAHIKAKQYLMRQYKQAVDITKNEWINVFDHEFAHKFDYNFKEGDLLLSELKKSPFVLDKTSFNISDYASKAKEPKETMAEAVRILMEERRRFSVLKGKASLTDEETDELLKGLLQKSPYKSHYNYIIENYLKKDGKIGWADIENYADYDFLKEEVTPSIDSFYKSDQQMKRLSSFSNVYENIADEDFTWSHMDSEPPITKPKGTNVNIATRQTSPLATFYMSSRSDKVTSHLQIDRDLKMNSEPLPDIMLPAKNIPFTNLENLSEVSNKSLDYTGSSKAVSNNKSEILTQKEIGGEIENIPTGQKSGEEAILTEQLVKSDISQDIQMNNTKYNGLDGKYREKWMNYLNSVETKEVLAKNNITEEEFLEWLISEKGNFSQGWSLEEVVNQYVEYKKISHIYDDMD
ncbi:MAG: hypothetical protein ABRQ39_27780, partial [Candidatus Eremiobacterota bacterium]